MSKRQETVREVCAEMYGKGGDDGYHLDIKRYADRILSAYEREVRKKSDSMIDIIGDGLDVALELKKRVELLERALKPVLDYDFGDYKTPWKPLMVEGELMKGCVRCGDGYPLSIVDEIIFGIDALIEMANAIGEAQRIMKEFTNGESHD